MHGFLTMIWWSSLALAVSAFSTFMILVLRRWLYARRLARTAQLRKAVLEKLFGYMDEQLTDVPLPGRREVTLAREAAIDLCHLVRGHERTRLTQLLDKVGFREDSLRDIRRGNVEDRRTAAMALQLYDDEETVKALRHALGDRNVDVCIAAADSLFVIDRLPPADVLAEQFEAQGVLHAWDVRKLFRDIARRDQHAVSRLVLIRGVSDTLRRVVADALGDAGDYAAIETLNSLAKDSCIDVRVAALDSFGRLGHPGAQKAIAYAFTDPAWQVRAEAAKAAGAIGLDILAGTMIALMNDDSWWVRFHAAQGLVKLGGKGIHALKQLAEFDSQAARMAALVLDEYGYHVLAGLGE